MSNMPIGLRTIKREPRGSLFFLSETCKTMGGTTTPPIGCFVLCDTFWGLQGVSLAPRRAPCFDAKCQNSYGVTFDKSNKISYLESCESVPLLFLGENSERISESSSSTKESLEFKTWSNR